MSYYMNIVRCDLIRTDMSKSIDEIDGMYLGWNWNDNDGKVERQATDLMVEGSNPSECVLPEYTRLGGRRKKIKLARTQATLF